MRTTIIGWLKSYVKKYQQEEKRIENRSLLESPAMIGYFEAKDIISLQQRIDKAIEYIEENTELEHDGDDYGYMEWTNVKLPTDLFIKNLLSILKGEDK